MKKILLISFIFILASCSTVTMRPNGGSKVTSRPDITQRENFFFWGLAPASVDVVLANQCGGALPSQFQAQSTFVDGLLGAITLGIYAPRSYRIWCR